MRLIDSPPGSPALSGLPVDVARLPPAPLSIVDRAYLIFEGRVESEGTKDFLVNDPISRQRYLGEPFKM
jgi:hypothetical protein